MIFNADHDFADDGQVELAPADAPAIAEGVFSEGIVDDADAILAERALNLVAQVTITNGAAGAESGDGGVEAQGQVVLVAHAVAVAEAGVVTEHCKAADREAVVAAGVSNVEAGVGRVRAATLSEGRSREAQRSTSDQHQHLGLHHRLLLVETGGGAAGTNPTRFLAGSVDRNHCDPFSRKLEPCTLVWGRVRHTPDPQT